MSVLSKLIAFCTGNAGKKVYIIDAAQLSGPGRPGGRLGPRDQIQILQRLSRFAEQEGIGVKAAFEGKSLREVANGEDFGKVTVFFAEQSKDLTDLLIDLYKRAGNSAVMVTSNPAVERAVQEVGGSTIRAMTFRKGMDGGGGGGGNGGGNGGGGGGMQRGGRQRRRPRDRDRRPMDRPQGDRPPQSERPQQDQPDDGGPQEPQQESQPSQSEPRGDDPVRNLIDLVE